MKGMVRHFRSSLCNSLTPDCSWLSCCCCDRACPNPTSSTATQPELTQSPHCWTCLIEPETCAQVRGAACIANHVAVKDCQNSWPQARLQMKAPQQKRANDSCPGLCARDDSFSLTTSALLGDRNVLLNGQRQEASYGDHAPE